MGIYRHRVKRAIDHPGFALAELGAGLLAGLALYLFPQLTWRPLVVAAFPALFRIFVGRSPFRRTPFDLPVFVFMLTALVGVWIAYERENAGVKFWFLASAVLLYYALARQPRQNAGVVLSLTVFSGLIVAAHFLLTHDWRSQPADFEIINQLAQWWTLRRPTVLVRPVHPNLAAGLLAMLVPLNLARAISAFRRRRAGPVIAQLLVLVVLIGTLIFTSSRAAWGALIAALVLWSLAGLGRSLGRGRSGFPNYIFIAALLIVLWIGILVAAASEVDFVRLFDRIPGYPSAASRVELNRNSIQLFRDFPLTGGGLHSFSGLYSQYILVVPSLVFGYSHNMFLDLLLEQGAFGFLSFMMVIGGTIWLLIRGSKAQQKIIRLRATVRWALSSGILVVLIHGIFDNSLYGNLGTPHLFVLPGLVVGLQGSMFRPPDRGLASPARNFRGVSVQWFIPATLVILAVAAGIIFQRPVASIVYANYGAVQMARVELRGWPTGEWDDGSRVSELADAEAKFRQSLALNPANRTAQYRLGLIAMQKRDYNTAVGHLEQALSGASQHPGVRKSLGYSYAWLAEYDRSEQTLAAIPEADSELETYGWWWKTQGRNDLAAMSLLMAERLRNNNQ